MQSVATFAPLTGFAPLAVSRTRENVDVRNFSTPRPTQLRPRSRTQPVRTDRSLRVPGSRRTSSFPNLTAMPSKLATSPTAQTPGAPPLQIMISGAPASGKGTQCEEIVKKYGLTHISAGDLLRAEVAADTEYGKAAKRFMDSGNLVPDGVVVTIVKQRLAQRDAQDCGWLLDGYPRSASQAQALEKAGIRPQIFILLEVPDEILVERVIGRRLDPVTGKIYHLTFSPPENAEVAARLTTRSDDTEEQVKNRLKTHKDNVNAVLDTYRDEMQRVDGNRPKEAVFTDIDRLLARAGAKEKEKEKEEIPELSFSENGSVRTAPQDSATSWVGVPTRLNSIPSGREIRHYFYRDACRAAKSAVEAGKKRIKDVYRIGTLLELMRHLAFTFADDGKRVRNLEAMAAAAGDRPLIIINSRLKDIPAASGVMQISGRDQRIAFTDSFEVIYAFRLLYTAGTQFPILGALRRAYPGPYEVYRRVDVSKEKEEYEAVGEFEQQPSSRELADALEGKEKTAAPTGLWGAITRFILN